MKKVIVPQENYDDIEEIVKETKLADLEIIFVSTMDEVIEKAFKPNTFKKMQKKIKKAITNKIKRNKRIKP